MIKYWFEIVRLCSNRMHAILKVLDIRRERGHQHYLQKELNFALAHDEMYVVYQPKLCLRRGIYDGVETLLRWQHPSLEEVDRGSIISLAEQTGQIHELTIWILKQAIADQQRLLQQTIELTFYVNISGKSLCSDSFIDRVSALVATAAGTIGFEITETAFIDNPIAALANLKRLADSDIRLSIDDYGSGHSSLAYLKELPADELKIDKLFISGMTRSNRDPLIVRSTIDLAHALGMRVVAEGVESRAALALLRVMGCDVAQGFFISPPLRIENLETFLGNRDHLNRLNDAEISLTPAKTFWSRSERDRAASIVPDSTLALD